MTNRQNYLKKFHVVGEESSAVTSSLATVTMGSSVYPAQMSSAAAHLYHKRPTPYLLWDDNIVPIHLTAHPSSSSTTSSSDSPPAPPSTFSCCRLFLALIIAFALVGVIVVITMTAYLGVMTTSLMEEMTNSEHLIGRLRVISGDDYSEVLEDNTSAQFLIKAHRYETMMDAVMTGSGLNEAYKGTKVIRFKPGSLVVFFRLILDRRKAVTPSRKWSNMSNVIRELIKKEVTKVNRNVTIDIESVVVWETYVPKMAQLESGQNATPKYHPSTVATTMKVPNVTEEDVVTTTESVAETSTTEVTSTTSTTTTTTTTTTSLPTTTTTTSLPTTVTSRRISSSSRSTPVTLKPSLRAEALTSGVAHEIPFSLDDFLFNRDAVKEQRVSSSVSASLDRTHPMETNVGAFLVLKTPPSSPSSSTTPTPKILKLSTANPLTTSPKSSIRHFQQPFWIESLPEVVVQSGTSVLKIAKRLELDNQPQRLPFSAPSSNVTTVEAVNVTDNMRMYSSDTVQLQDTEDKSDSDGVTPSDEQVSSDDDDLMLAEDVIYSTVVPSLSMSAAYVEQNFASCPKLSDFRCHDGSGCVSNVSRCNQMKDCYDNSDEEGCTCADFLHAQFLQGKICDGVVDCWDYSDENRCGGCSPSMYVCQNSNVCITHSQICDSLLDCPYGDDERHCLELSSNSSGHLRDNYYRSNGFLLMRKNGRWGQLCVDNFPKHAIRTGVTPLGLTELAKSVCRALTFEDFVTIERKRLPLYPRVVDQDEMFYEINYLPSNINSTRPILQFTQSQCRSREVVWIQCKQLECGIRPMAARARIVGGANSLAGSWPWQAAMYKNGDYMCGATLLNDQWLLSAAHCFFNEVDNYWTARLGMLRRGSQAPYEQIHQTSHIIIHPQYVKVGFINDVALLRLQTPVKFSDYVRPVCHPSLAEESITNGRMCTVIGWGQLQETGHIFPDTLQEVELPIFDAAECRKKTVFLQSYQITDNMFCAGYDRGGRDACLGDSGGPLVCQENNGKWTLVGITSNGFGCARAWRPGIYTKVANYLTWMNQIMASPLRIPWVRSHCAGHRCQLGKCLSAASVCNGYMECLDGSDERHCSS